MQVSSIVRKAVLANVDKYSFCCDSDSVDFGLVVLVMMIMRPQKNLSVMYELQATRSVFSGNVKEQMQH